MIKNMFFEHLHATLDLDSQLMIYFAKKSPCGTTFRLKIQFYPPKRPLRDAFPAQNTILSAQKAPARRFSNSKYNFIHPKAPSRDACLLQNTRTYSKDNLHFECFLTPVSTYSNHGIYDIGTKILLLQ